MKPGSSSREHRSGQGRALRLRQGLQGAVQRVPQNSTWMKPGSCSMEHGPDRGQGHVSTPR